MFRHEQWGKGLGTLPERIITGALTAATVAGAALALASGASAGEFVQSVCLNPNGTQAGMDGWTPSQEQPGGATIQTVGCGPSSAGSQYPETPIYVEAVGGGPNEASAEWTYTATPNTIVGGTLTTEDGYDQAPETEQSATGEEAGSSWVSLGADTHGGAGDIVDCWIFSGIGNCAGGPPNYTPFSTSDGALTTFPIPAVPNATQLFVHASTCAITGPGCGANGAISLYSAKLVLQNTTTPVESGTQGNLLGTQANPAHGTSSLSFTVSDPGGPGVQAVNVLVDGTSVYQAQVPNGNPNTCQPVGTDPSTGLPIYDLRAPCVTLPTTLSVPNGGIVTGTLADGQHDLAIQVTDAAGNVATFHTTIWTLNRSTPSSTTTEKQGSTGATGSTGGGSASAPPVVVVPPPTVTVTTGKPAGPTPHYSLTLSPTSAKLADSKALHRTYYESGIVLSGTVLGTSGVGLADAPVTVTALAPAGRPQVVAHILSNGAGAFTVRIPRGDTRTLKLIASAGTVTMHEIVTPTVTTTIRQVGTHTIQVSGLLGLAEEGSRPQLDLEIHDRGTWQLLGHTITANHDGRFGDTYAATPGARHGDYRVRLVLLAGPDWAQVITAAHTVTL